MKKTLIDIITIVKTFIVFRYFPPRNIKKRQQRLERKIHRFAKKNSQFYQQRTDFPVMNKLMMMKHFNTINTVGLDRDKAFDLAIKSEKEREFEQTYNNITVGLSSGTSGNRGLFIVSKRERNQWAGAILAKTLPKRHIFHHKIAFFMRADSNLYETVQSKKIQFKFFDMYQDMNQNIVDLDLFQPTILVAPPSVLMVIAKQIQMEQIKINPQKVISVAEVLEEKDKTYFKKVFQQEVIHQVYQCTEGFLGTTCEYGTLHLNEEIVKIEREYLDKYRFIPIITDLVRTSQPIIRYRLNDILIERKDTCPCGSKHTAIDSIEGRTDDIFIFQNESHEDVPVFSDFIRRCVLFVDGIGEYKIIQTTKTHIDIYLSQSSKKMQLEIKQEFEQLAKDMLFTMPTISFHLYQHDFSRKLKRVERTF